MSHFRDLIGQDDTVGNDGDTPGFSAPIGPGEIEELLYNDGWTASARIERLVAIRSELAGLESPDFGDDDPRTLIRQIDAAIGQLQNLDGEAMDPAGMDMDASAHRETLSPDSDELLDLEALDAESLDDDDEPGEGAIDKREWIDGLDLDEKK